MLEEIRHIVSGLPQLTLWRVSLRLIRLDFCSVQKVGIQLTSLESNQNSHSIIAGGVQTDSTNKVILPGTPLPYLMAPRLRLHIPFLVLLGLVCY